MGRQVLNRKQYKDIKKMDHNQMSGFMEDIYRSGFEEGKKKAGGLSEEEIKSTVMKIKGVGEKKAEEIAAALAEIQKAREAG